MKISSIFKLRKNRYVEDLNSNKNNIIDAINKCYNEDKIIDIINKCSDNVLDYKLFDIIEKKVPNWRENNKFCSSYKFMKMAVRGGSDFDILCCRGENLKFATCEIDDELVTSAILNGYALNKESPDFIKNNSKYIKMISRCGDINQIDYAERELDDELIDMALKRNYKLSSSSHADMKKSRKVLEWCIKKYGGNQIDYATCEIDDELINLAIEYSYSLSLFNSDNVKNYRKMLEAYIKKYGGNQIDYAKCEIDDELINLALDHHYYLSNSKPVNMSNHQKIVKACIKKYDVNRINYAKCEIDEELIELALNNNYELFSHSHESMKNNRKVVEACIQNHGGNQLNYAQCEIDDELIELALNNNYELSESSHISMKNNRKVIEECIKKYGGNQLNYAQCEIDDELIELALNNNYELFSHSHESMKNNRKVVEACIQNHGGNQLNYAQCEIDDELFLLAFDFGLNIQVHNLDRYKNVNLKSFLDDFLKDKSDEYKNKISYIKENTNAVLIFMLKDNLLLDERIINELGEKIILRYIKYLYLLGKPIDFNILTNDENLQTFKFIFSEILEKSFENVSIEDFYNISNNFSLYINLIKDIINTGTKLSLEDKNKIIKLFKNNDNRLNINKVTDLNNITSMIIRANEKDIASNDLNTLKNAIYLTCFNFTNDDISKLLNVYNLNASKIEELIKVIKDKKSKKILSNYLVLFEMIEFIENCQNISLLQKFLIECNTNLSNNNDYFENLHNLFFDIDNKIKYFYGVEISEKTSNENIGYKIENESLKSIDNQNVTLKSVDSNCYYFQHTLNAYGDGGKLSDFKNQRLVGRTYICLSLINNNHKGVLREPIDVDHVTLLFDKLPAESLCVFSERDIYSHAVDNERDIHYNYANFDTVDNTLSKTNTYNEYVYYRENNDGSYIYPCGILVTGLEPCQAEIDAAAYLGVPLIKLNPVKEKEKKEITQKENTNSKNNDTIKELKDMKDKLLKLSNLNNNQENNISGRSR